MVARGGAEDELGMGAPQAWGLRGRGETGEPAPGDRFLERAE